MISARLYTTAKDIKTLTFEKFSFYAGEKCLAVWKRSFSSLSTKTTAGLISTSCTREKENIYFKYAGDFFRLLFRFVGMEEIIVCCVFGEKNN